MHTILPLTNDQANSERKKKRKFIPRFYSKCHTSVSETNHICPVISKSTVKYSSWAQESFPKLRNLGYKSFFLFLFLFDKEKIVSPGL